MDKPTPFSSAWMSTRSPLPCPRHRRTLRAAGFVGPIGTRQRDIDQVVRRLQTKAARLVFAYEAGPCSYMLHRYLSRKGLERVAPRARHKSRIASSSTDGT
jgi:hypothetical protein